MSSPNAKTAKKWKAFVSRLAKQANFVCDGPIEVSSFTNPEGSEVQIENLSQLRQVFQDNAGDSNQLQLHLKGTTNDGVVHHTSLSIRRPAQKSRRRHKAQAQKTSSTSPQTSDLVSHDSSLSHTSSSLIMHPHVPSPMSFHEHSEGFSSANLSHQPEISPNTPSPVKSRRIPQKESVSMSLSPRESGTRHIASPKKSPVRHSIPESSSLTQSPAIVDSPLPSAIPSSKKASFYASVTPEPSAEEQRYNYYSARQNLAGGYVEGLRGELAEEQAEIPRRQDPPDPPISATSPFVSPPPARPAIPPAPRTPPLGVGLPPAEANADLSASIRDLTSQLHTLIQQQQAQMAVQTASTVASINAIQSEARSRTGSASSTPDEVSPARRRNRDEDEKSRAENVSATAPQPSTQLGDKLDQLSQHITQIGSVVDKFNESAKLIHESVQNLMTTSLSIQQQQQQHMSMSQMNFPPNSFMVTGVQTPQGVMYYPIESQDTSQSMINVVPGNMPVFRPASVGSSYISTGTPILRPGSAPQTHPMEDFRMGSPAAHNQPSHEKHMIQVLASPQLVPSNPTMHVPAVGRSASLTDVLHSSRISQVTPPMRTSSAKLVGRAANRSPSAGLTHSDPQLKPILKNPVKDGLTESLDNLQDTSPSLPKSGSTGSAPSASDVDNSNSQRLSASGGSQDSGVSEALKEKLRILKEMGYKNRTFNLVLLQQNNGDIDSVIADLKQFEQYK